MGEGYRLTAEGRWGMTATDGRLWARQFEETIRGGGWLPKDDLELSVIERRVPKYSVRLSRSRALRNNTTEVVKRPGLAIYCITVPWIGTYR